MRGGWDKCWVRGQCGHLKWRLKSPKRESNSLFGFRCLLISVAVFVYLPSPFFLCFSIVIRVVCFVLSAVSFSWLM